MANGGQTLGIKGQTHGSAPTQKQYDNKSVGVDPCVHPLETKQYKCNRRSLRLPHYDYTKAGYYFITITAQNREHLFGEIADGVMVLNVAREMVAEWYDKLEDKFPNVINHDMVIMPNHIHFVIEIVGADPCVRPSLDPYVPSNMHENKILNDEYRRGTPMCVPSNMDENKMWNMQSKGQTHESKGQTHGIKGQTHGSAPTGVNVVSVGDVIQWFKTMTTNTYIKMVKNGTLPPFNKRIWQRNFYEHVIRDDGDYVRIAEYIQNNPLSWHKDMLNKP